MYIEMRVKVHRYIALSLKKFEWTTWDRQVRTCFKKVTAHTNVRYFWTDEPYMYIHTNSVEKNE